jgi:hypothetical protein
MGEPFGKASGRTFRPKGTRVSYPYWNSPLVKSGDSLKTSDEPPFDALESGLPVAVYATAR